jgi:hypothetical protein
LIRVSQPSFAPYFLLIMSGMGYSNSNHQKYLFWPRARHLLSRLRS